MRKELITPEELMSQLREQGLESLEEVREAYIEGDGQISFIKRKDGEVQKQKRKAVV
ncbi:MAG: YetF domain-containing protein [Roseiflexaceae bacterium]